MKILFDSNAFAYLSQRTELLECIRKPKYLGETSQIDVIGSCTLLQELSGLARSNVTMYLTTLSRYEELIRGRILKPPNDILIEEGEQLRPLSFDQSLLDQDSVRNLSLRISTMLRWLKNFLARLDHSRASMTKSRMEAFSDGVIAIIITIMVDNGLKYLTASLFQ